jgi:biopolymer transport protein TolR
MGATMNSMSSGHSRRRGRRFSPLSEINVTPFVDVMLVMLVVFMVTAPLLTVGVNVSLPKTEATALQDDVEPMVVSIDEKGEIFVQEKQVPFDKLVPILISVTQNNRDVKIYIRGEKSLSYESVMRVMGTISAAGFEKVALIADLPNVG